MAAINKFQSVSDTTDAPLGRGIKRFTIRTAPGTLQAEIETLGYFKRTDLRSWQAGDLISVITDTRVLTYAIVGNQNPARDIEVELIPNIIGTDDQTASEVPAESGAPGSPTEGLLTVQTQLAALSNYLVTLQGEVDSLEGAGFGDLLSTNNLSDLDDAGDARGNLGLGTAAVKNTGTSGNAVPLLNAANTWSGVQTIDTGGSSADALKIQGATPGWFLYEDDTSADEGKWRCFAVSGELFFQSVNDAQSVGYTWLRVDRSSHTVTDIKFFGSLISLNGNSLLDVGDIGTSGATIPLLNGVNTWASLQTFSSGVVIGPTGTSYVAGSLGFSDTNFGFIYRPPQAGAISAHAFTSFAGTILFQVTEAGVFSVLGNAVLDVGDIGTSGSVIPLLSTGNTWGALQQFLAANETTDGARITNSASSRRLHLFAGKVGSQNGNLDLDAQDGNDINFQISGSTKAALKAAGNFDLGSGAAQSNALLRVRLGGNAIEFGHANPSGFGCTLGAQAGNGVPFLAFNAEHGTTNNTYLTRGIPGSGVRPDHSGGLIFFKVATASADNQSPTDLMALSAAGVLTLGGEAVARVDSGTAANSGKISWGTAAPGTLAEGEIYLQYDA